MTLRPQYLRVRNWEKFQHYKNRRPPWIKLHIELLDDYDLLKLPPVAQLVYDRMLLLAAVTDNNVSNDHAWIAGKLGLTVRQVSAAVESLCSAGFLVVHGRKRPASKAIAKGKQSALSEAEEETETKTEKKDLLAKGRSVARGVLPFEKQQKIDKLIRWCGDHADSRTEGQLATIALEIPEGPLAKVLESCLQARDVRNRAGYALKALMSEAAECAA